MDLSTILISNDFKKTNDPYHKRYRCPSCGEQKYRFYIHFKKKVYICFRCGISGRLDGEILTSVDHYESKVEDFKNGQSSTQDREYIDLPKEIIRPLRRASGLPYLYLRKRGITEAEIDRYQMGYCSEGIYRERIIIPIYGNSSQPVYFIARSYTAREPKYINARSGRSKTIFKSFTGAVDFCILVEGVFTAIYVSRIFPSIAILGKVISEAQCKKIAECTKQVYVMLDSNAKKENLESAFKLGFFLSAKPIFITKPAPDSYSYEELERLINENLFNTK